MAGFSDNQAKRLERKFHTVQQLADELFLMREEDEGITTSHPITLIRNNDGVPMIKIVDNTDGDFPPIQLIRKKGDEVPTEAMDPGGFQCCGKKGSSGGGGGGGNNPPVPNLGGGSPGGGTVQLAQPPVGVPYRVFCGRIQVRLSKGGDDPYGFNGNATMFSGCECKPYNPPAIPAPTSALAIGDIGRQLDSFVARWKLDGASVFEDIVTGVGGICQPGQQFNSDLANLPHFPDP